MSAFSHIMPRNEALHQNIGCGTKFQGYSEESSTCLKPWCFRQTIACLFMSTTKGNVTLSDCSRNCPTLGVKSILLTSHLMGMGSALTDFLSSYNGGTHEWYLLVTLFQAELEAQTVTLHCQKKCKCFRTTRQ